MPTRKRSNQAIVNAFPPWSRIRDDEQSFGYQILNLVNFDDLQEQLQNLSDNFFLLSSHVEDPDVFYTTSLPSTYTFVKEDSDTSSLPFTPPTISGILGGSSYLLQVSDENTLEHFWYKTPPYSFSVDNELGESTVLASGQLTQTIFTPLLVSGFNTNKLTIKLSGAQSCIAIEDENLIRRAIVLLHGKNRQGMEIWEEIPLFFDTIQQTMNEYSYLYPDNGIRVVGVQPNTAEFLLTTANFNSEYRPISYELDTTKEDNPMPLFWALGKSSEGYSTIDILKYQAETIELRLEGYIDKEVMFQQELYDTAGNHINALDFVTEPFQNRMWVVDSEKIYIFSTDFPYPNLSQLTKKQYDAASIVEINTNTAVLGDTIEVNYTWAKPTNGISAHRAWVQKPDGNKFSLEYGSEVAYHTNTSSWIFGDPNDRRIRAPEFYVLDQLGDYIYTLEVRYTDGTSSIDQRICSTLFQKAIQEYTFASLYESGNILGIDIDSENKIWLLATVLSSRADYGSGTFGSAIYGGEGEGAMMEEQRLRLLPFYTSLLIDFDNKVLYTREAFDSIEVF
jgi:hypothetical protein